MLECQPAVGLTKGTEAHKSGAGTSAISLRAEATETLRGAQRRFPKTKGGRPLRCARPSTISRPPYTNHHTQPTPSFARMVTVERYGLFASNTAFRSNHVWPFVIHAGAGSPFR